MEAVLKLSNLPKKERPRERFELKGSSAVSLRELLAISINNGNKQNSALDIADKMLSDFGALEEIDKASIAKLCSCAGIGYAKAIRIKAALELGKRFYAEQGRIRESIFDSAQAFQIASYYLKGKMQEHLLLFCLNVRGGLISEPDIVSMGILDASCIHPREIFKKAIEKCAARILLAHNHPSGSSDPSAEDLHTTSIVYKAGTLLGIELIDHLVVAGNSFCSIREFDADLFSA